MYPYVCQHENDLCTIVLIASPLLTEIEICNRNFEKCLYKQPICIERLKEQYQTFIQTLQHLNITVIDVTPLLTLSTIESDVTYSSEDVSNLIFTRDPILCTPNGVVFGKFKESIRANEINLLKTLLNFGESNKFIYQIQGARSVVEGGDYIPLGKMCFIANGNRTNLEGIFELMQMDVLSSEMVCVVHYPIDHKMQTIHLDCYLGIVGNRHAVVWDEACHCATVSVYMKNDKATYVPLSHTTPLGIFLEMCGFELIKVNTACQEAYGCNLLDLGDGVVLTQDEYVTQELIKQGYDAIHIPFDEVHKMYGGIRCATQVLHRKPLYYNHTEDVKEPILK